VSNDRGFMIIKRKNKRKGKVEKKKESEDLN